MPKPQSSSSERSNAAPEMLDGPRPGIYDPIWNIQGDKQDDCEFVRRAIRQTAVASGRIFHDSAEAVDIIVDEILAYRVRCGRQKHDWCITLLEMAFAEYCAEQSTRYYEISEIERSKTFEDLEHKTRDRFALGRTSVYAIRCRYAQVPDSDVQTGDSVSELDKEKAARKKLRNDYKAECKRAGALVTDEMIATAANSRWHSRANIQKWLACDEKYNGGPDKQIRKVFREKPHLRAAQTTAELK